MDYRATLKPKPGGISRVLGPNSADNVMQPLYKTGGIIFPYTPIINYTTNADYKKQEFTHSNYQYNAYSRSYVTPFTLEASFTAQTMPEAKYMLAAINFFKTASKMEFGKLAGKYAGVPPPVLNFSYLGKQLFDNVPVVIESFSLTFDNSVSFVEIPEWETKVPTLINFTITLNQQYNVNYIQETFKLSDLKQGKYLGNKGTGGFI